MSVSSSGALGVSGSLLTNDGATGNLQLTGLASGLNTNEIIQAELAVQELPLTNEKDEISAMDTENITLGNIQLSLQNLSLDAWALGEPSLYFNVQSVTSSNTAAVTAQTSNGIGAVIGSSEVTISQLASASQRTFALNNLTTDSSGNQVTSAADNFAIDGQTVSVAAGSTVSEIAEQINHDNSLDVYASVNSQNQLVLSGRSTGNLDNGGDTYISVTDGTDSTGAGGTLVSGDGSGETTVGSGPLLTEVTSAAQEGKDALYTINGVAGQSTTDTVTNAIAGVTLNLIGVTNTLDPVTITTGVPGPDTASILAAVQSFVNDYNSIVEAIESAVNTAPASETTPADYSPYSGSLFGDDQLEDLLNQMRQAIYQPASGLPSGMNSLSEIGISTGALTGSASSTANAGLLTVDTSQLESALSSNPTGVENMLEQWSQSFQNVVNDAASPTGSLQARINGNSTEIGNLQDLLTSQTALFNQQEASMQEQWAQVESTLETLDNQKTSLTTFSNNLSTTSSSSG
jgi:flagellar hook-associated protein 2